jgi:hypothetical protein
MANKEIKDKLVAAGVKNLKEFGYPSVNASNIVTDYVFSRFFVSMLNQNKGHGKDVDAAIDELLAEIAKKEKPKKKQKEAAITLAKERLDERPRLPKGGNRQKRGGEGGLHVLPVLLREDGLRRGKR